MVHSDFFMRKYKIRSHFQNLQKIYEKHVSFLQISLYNIVNRSILQRSKPLSKKVLIVEDELSIVTLIKYNVEQAGFETDVAFDGEEAIKKISNNQYDLIILDLMLPKIDGLDICKFVRSENKSLPILMVTALNEEEDIINGLNSGADDYITKPFSPKELIARMNAVLRRSSVEEGKNGEAALTAGELEIYPDNFEAYFKGEPLQLTRKEYELLVYFVRNKGMVLSRDQLLSHVWDYEIAGDTRIVDVHVARLREKIEKDKRNPQYIKTIHGFGYKMEEPTL